MSRVSAFRWAKVQFVRAVRRDVQQAIQKIKIYVLKRYARPLNGFAGERICVKRLDFTFWDHF